jgi:hypothetical protein
MLWKLIIIIRYHSNVVLHEGKINLIGKFVSIFLDRTTNTKDSRTADEKKLNMVGIRCADNNKAR